MAGHSISPTVRQAVGQPVGQLDNQRVQPQDSWTIGQTAKHLVPHETFEKHTQQAQDMDTLWLSSTRKGAAAAGGTGSGGQASGAAITVIITDHTLARGNETRRTAPIDRRLLMQ